MITRRGFVYGLLALPLATTCQANVQALQYLDPNTTLKRAWVAQPRLIQQQCALWCWAASIAMIFESHDHPLDQHTIVQATFGANICVSSGNTYNIGQNLSRSWIDVNGRGFTSRVVAAYDAMNGINNLTNDYIVDQLSNNHPLLYCNRHHAMVLVSIDYLETPQGRFPQTAGVLDPWPSMGFHQLTQNEIYMAGIGGDMTFLAAVDVY